MNKLVFIKYSENRGC